MCTLVEVCVCTLVVVCVCTLVEVGEAAFALLLPGFFFLILIPGTGAELRASRKPVDSMAAMRQSHSCQSASVHM